jgi:hypothetical protein
MAGPASELCEWDPEQNQPAIQNLDGSNRRGCPRLAMFCVGVRENWHLCGRCVELPRFRRFRRIEFLARSPGQQRESAP